MLRIPENINRCAILDHPPEIHHRHIIRHLRYHAQIMRNDDNRRAEVLLQLLHQVDNLRLNRDIQRRSRLVRDQDRRIARQRQRNHHALTHPAAQLMWILLDPLLRIGDAHAVQHINRHLQRLFFAEALVQFHHFRNLPANRMQRIQRGHRLLKDHRDLAAADAAHLHALGVELDDIDRFGAALLPAKNDLALDDFARRGLDQLHDRMRRDALATAAFAHDAQRLPVRQAEADTLDRLHHPLVGEEMRLQIADFQDRLRATAIIHQ